MQIHNSGYPEGADLSHFDGDGDDQRLQVTGQLGFGFKCPHCNDDIFAIFSEFEFDDALEYQCEHCDHPLSLEI